MSCMQGLCASLELKLDFHMMIYSDYGTELLIQQLSSSVFVDVKNRSAQSTSSRSTFDMLHHSNHLVDRFAVLLDVWTCHVNFLHNKREVCLLIVYIDEQRGRFDCVIDSQSQLFLLITTKVQNVLTNV